MDVDEEEPSRRGEYARQVTRAVMTLIGAAAAGLLAESSIETAILVLGVGGAVAGAASAAFLVPRREPAPGTSA